MPQPIGAFITGCAGLSLTAGEIDFLSRRRPWGLILFRRNCQTPEQVRALCAGFRAAVGRSNAPVFVDQEGGRVQRLGPPSSNAWRQYPPARAYGRLFETSPLAALRAARNVGRLMAEDLLACGISVNCVPVLDVPQPDAHEIIGSRAYGSVPERIIALARAHVAGFAEGGLLAVMKHVPGHGRARADSHERLPVVEASLAELEAVDFPPFAAAADLPMAMTAHVVFTALDPCQPATLSPAVIADIVRGTIGFRGLLISDDLSMKALDGGLGERALKARRAGCDIALHCNGEMAEMEEVAAAAGPLRGLALSRARAALAMARKPQPFDRDLAERDLEALVSA